MLVERTQDRALDPMGGVDALHPTEGDTHLIVESVHVTGQQVRVDAGSMLSAPDRLP